MADICRQIQYGGKPRSFSCYLKKRFDFSIKSPPLPVPELEVRGTVPLQDSDCVQLLNFLLIVPEHQRNLQLNILQQISWSAGQFKSLNQKINGMTWKDLTTIDIGMRNMKQLKYPCIKMFNLIYNPPPFTRNSGCPGHTA